MPKLAAAHATLRDRLGKQFDVVYISADSDAAGVADACTATRWMALPYVERGINEALTRHFGVSELPTLVLSCM